MCLSALSTLFKLRFIVLIPSLFFFFFDFAKAINSWSFCFSLLNGDYYAHFHYNILVRILQIILFMTF